MPMLSISEENASLSLQSGHRKQEMPSRTACPCSRNIRSRSEALVLLSTCRAPGAREQLLPGCSPCGTRHACTLGTPWCHRTFVPDKVQADEAGGVLPPEPPPLPAPGCAPRRRTWGKRKGMGGVRSAGSFPGGSEEERVQRVTTNFIVLVEGAQDQHTRGWHMAGPATSSGLPVGVSGSTSQAGAVSHPRGPSGAGGAAALKGWRAAGGR